MRSYTGVRMSSGRKSPRVKVSTPAMIYDAGGTAVMTCTVRDISATGVGLKLDIDMPLPDPFLLALTRDGHVRRLCRPVWQLSIVAGVRFADPDDAGSALKSMVITGQNS